MDEVVGVPLAAGRLEIDTVTARMRFVNSAGAISFDFKLTPCIEYVGAEGKPERLRLVRHDGRHLVFAGCDGVCEIEAHVEIGEGRIDYRAVAKPAPRDAVGQVGQVRQVRHVYYGQDGAGHENASAHRLDEFFIICPDRYGSAIPKSAKICFKLGVPSFRFDKDNNFPHEGGRTIIAPYFAALKGGADWLGVGTLEIPTCEYGLNMLFRDGRAVIGWHYGGSLKLDRPFAFPKITFFAAKDKLAAGRAYIGRLYADGLARRNTAWDESWSGPIYCFFSDQMYEYQTDRATLELEGELAMTDAYCNDAFLDRCLRFLEEKAIPYRIIIIDYGWFQCAGTWQVNAKRFKDFKAAIARLQGMGKKVLVWYAPYFYAEQSAAYREHPECVAKKPGGEGDFITRLGAEKNYLNDFTHPTTRELLRRDFEFILGRDGLNADGIKLDCTQQLPDIEDTLHDSSWGTGEMYHYKASKFMYDTAKQIKPDCCVNATAGNPLFNGTFDLHRIHDGMEYNLNAYEERAWAMWFCRGGISDLDDWPSHDIFTVRANLRKIAYGTPSLYAARKRAGQRKWKAGWGYSISAREDELQLLAAIYELHARVPVDLTQEIMIDPFAGVFNRRYTTGKLKGFYAVTTLSGNQAVVAYDENEARIVGISDVALSVPLPPNAKDVRLRVVERDGRERKVKPSEVIAGEMVFEARRCCGDVKCYRITYSL